MSNYTYLDNAAGMPVSPETAGRLAEYAEKFYANPESIHKAGIISREATEKAAEKIISTLTGRNDYSLFWTSSATEAINILFGFPGFAGKNLLTTDVEHPALLHAAERAQFCEIRKITIRRDGMIDEDSLKEMLDENTAAVAVHHVHNEIGAIQNLVKIRKVINTVNPDILLIADTVQSIAKIAIPWYKAEINAAFIGGHKTGAPSGGALLYNFHGRKIPYASDFPKYLKNLRRNEHITGRTDPAICMTLADTVTSISLTDISGIAALNKKMRDQINALMQKTHNKVIFPVASETASPYILTIILPGFQGEILVRMLSDKGIMVSAGSACEAYKERPSTSLTAMGISEKDARSAIRISFSHNSSANDIKNLINALEDVLKEY